MKSMTNRVVDRAANALPRAVSGAALWLAVALPPAVPLAVIFAGAALSPGARLAATAAPAAAPQDAPAGSSVGEQAPSAAQHYYGSLRWRQVGPFRGGRSSAAAGIADDKLTYYFGGAGGGVWKTEDAGTTWRNVSDGFLGTSSVGALAVAPSDVNVVYAGMGEHAIRGVTTSHGDGVYRSTDAGRTWQHLGLEDARAISRIRVHPFDSDHVYVAAQGDPFSPSAARGIYRSTDGGATWRLVLHVDENTGASDLAMDPTNPRILYAAMWDHDREPWAIRSGGPGSGFWKSTDGGDTWNRLSDGLPAETGKTAIDVSASHPDRVWALVEASVEEDGLYRSDDGGATWTHVSSDRVLVGRSWYYIEVYADPQDHETVYVMNSPFLRSIDGGRTWETIVTPHVDHHDLWINPHDSQVMLSANDGGATLTFNGGETWSTQENQPTAQIYRLTVDNLFPYWLYGGQQDNTSVAIKGWVTHGGGIDWKDWGDAGGGESAWVAFDPDNPRFLYSTSIQGIIQEVDTKFGSVRSVSVYPQFQLGMDAEDMRYRWNWNAPVVVSPHDPETIYHGSQHLLRSRDRGFTWEEISPDLTRNQPERHGAAGGPFNNEAAGGEVYNTIFNIVESPRTPGVIWVGTDDGRVRLTRDAGATWEDITPHPRLLPDGAEEGLVNSLEVSPHQPGAAYITLARYKFGDFAPYVLKTSDYGETWRRIDDDLAEAAPDGWARVVREDPARRGLLYAGTELGVWVSFDDGESWQTLQQNLPNTPITDLRVAHGDVIVSTQGRGFWVLDAPEPLRQMDGEFATAGGGDEARLFAPPDGYRVSQGLGGAVGPVVQGENKTPGVPLDYILPSGASAELEILDGDGNLVRTFRTPPGDEPEGQDETDEPDEADEGSTKLLPAGPGHNRIYWDLRVESAAPVPAEPAFFGMAAGYRVMPGTYSARLTVNGEALPEKQFRVTGDPRTPESEKDYAANRQFLEDVFGAVSELHDGVIDLRDARVKAAEVTDRVRRAEIPDADELLAAGAELADSINAAEDRLFQKRRGAQQDMVAYEGLLNMQLSALIGEVDGTDLPPTRGALDRFEDLRVQWESERAAIANILGAMLDRFNDLARQAGVPAVITPSPRTIS